MRGTGSVRSWSWVTPTGTGSSTRRWRTRDGKARSPTAALSTIRTAASTSTSRPKTRTSPTDATFERCCTRPGTGSSSCEMTIRTWSSRPPMLEASGSGPSATVAPWVHVLRDIDGDGVDDLVLAYRGAGPPDVGATRLEFVLGDPAGRYKDASGGTSATAVLAVPYYSDANNPGRRLRQRRRAARPPADHCGRQRGRTGRRPSVRLWRHVRAGGRARHRFA